MAGSRTAPRGLWHRWPALREAHPPPPADPGGRPSPHAPSPPRPRPTLPKLPFPMARRIWKWSRFTAERAEGRQVRGQQGRCPPGPPCCREPPNTTESPQHCRVPLTLWGAPHNAGSPPMPHGVSDTLRNPLQCRVPSAAGSPDTAGRPPTLQGAPVGTERSTSP